MSTIRASPIRSSKRSIESARPIARRDASGLKESAVTHPSFALIRWRDLRGWIESDGLELLDYRGFNALPFVQIAPPQHASPGEPHGAHMFVRGCRSVRDP